MNDNAHKLELACIILAVVFSVLVCYLLDWSHSPSEHDGNVKPKYCRNSDLMMVNS